MEICRVRILMEFHSISMGTWSGENPYGIPLNINGNLSGEDPYGIPFKINGNWSGENPYGIPFKSLRSFQLQWDFVCRES